MILKNSYRLDELAELWETSIQTIRRMIKRGGLQAFKVGATWRVLDEERRRVESRVIESEKAS